MPKSNRKKLLIENDELKFLRKAIKEKLDLNIKKNNENLKYC